MVKGEVKREARGKFRVALGGTTCRSASQRAQTPRSSLRLMHPGWKKACGGQATRHGTLQQRRETNRKQRTYRLRTVGVGGICRGVSVSVKKRRQGGCGRKWRLSWRRLRGSYRLGKSGGSGALTHYSTGDKGSLQVEATRSLLLQEGCWGRWDRDWHLSGRWKLLRQRPVGASNGRQEIN